MFDLPENAICYADSARGIFIPQYFAESIRRDLVQNVTQEDWNILESGPDHESYWDAWDDITSSAILTDDFGDTWTLYQEGDLWLVPANWTPEG